VIRLNTHHSMIILEYSVSLMMIKLKTYYCFGSRDKFSFFLEEVLRRMEFWSTPYGVLSGTV
jgi:hypothetical protein